MLMEGEQGGGDTGLKRKQRKGDTKSTSKEIFGPNAHE